MRRLQRIGRAIASAQGRLRAAIELRDVFWIGGLAAVCYGVSQVQEPAAWIVGGSVTFWMGIRA